MKPELTREEIAQRIISGKKCIVMWEESKAVYGHAVFGFTGLEALGLVEALKPSIHKKVTEK